jgi:hypothetical protein
LYQLSFREPDLYFGQNLAEQLTEVLSEEGSEVEDSLLDCLDGLARRLVADEEGSTTRLERDLARPVLEVREWGREACWTAWTAWYATLWQMRKALPLVWSRTWPVLYLR